MTARTRSSAPAAAATDAGCAALAAALDGGALPALEDLNLYDTLASEAVRDALMARFRADSDDNSDEE